MKSKNSIWTVACAALVSLYGCANFTSFQTADVSRPDEVTFGGALAFVAYDIRDTSENLYVPAAYLWGRYGITDRLQIHGTIWPGPISIGAKYQIVGSRDELGLGIAGGVDLGMGLFSIKSDTLRAMRPKTDIYLPLYLSYDLSEGFSIYLTPKYILSINDSALVSPSSSVAGALGGKFKSLYFEGSIGYDFLAEESVVQVGVGVDF